MRYQPVVAAPESDAQAAQAVVADVAQAKPAAALAEIEPVSHAAHPRQRVKPGSVLAARAATEYVYVAQDMRRILVVAAALFGVLAILWVLIIFLRVVELPFY